MTELQRIEFIKIKEQLVQTAREIAIYVKPESRQFWLDKVRNRQEELNQLKEKYGYGNTNANS
jgi:hypothetical protein